jgi:hypothetical protein
METLNFEAVKIAMKQDKTGHILTLNIHPDEVPESLFRDFVGARYQVVMVRLGEDNKPMNREQQLAPDYVRMAGMLCRDKSFHLFLVDGGHTFEDTEAAATEWIKEWLGVTSRADIPASASATQKLLSLYEEFQAWKRNV